MPWFGLAVLRSLSFYEWNFPREKTFFWVYNLNSHLYNTMTFFSGLTFFQDLPRRSAPKLALCWFDFIPINNEDENVRNQSGHSLMKVRIWGNSVMRQDHIWSSLVLFSAGDQFKMLRYIVGKLVCFLQGSEVIFISRWRMSNVLWVSAKSQHLPFHHDYTCPAKWLFSQRLISQ